MTEKDYPLTYVIILTWNQKEMTADCLDSVMRLDYPNYRIALIDNCSTDGTREYIRTRHPQVEIIPSETNLGYAGGNNLGLDYALRRGAEYVLILNNDTEIDPGCLSKLVEVMERDEAVGVAGATIYYHSDPKRIWFNGARLNENIGEMEAYSFKSVDEGQFTEIIESDYAPGCGMLVRSSAVKRSGGIDARYFIYFEESDWCLRIKKLGYSVVIHPAAKVWHKISMAFGKETPTFLYYMVRNNLLFMRSNLPLRTRWLGYIKCLKRCILQLRWLVRSSDEEKWTKARAICTGLFDFLLCRFGRGSAQFLLPNSR